MKNDYSQISYVLLRNKILSSAEKLFIAHVVQNGGQTKETNIELAKEFGFKPDGIKSLLKRLKAKHNFISFDRKGVGRNRVISVDNTKLEQFLNQTI